MVWFIARFIVGAFLVFAGIAKFFDLDGFYRSVRSFRLLSPGASKLGSTIHPFLEILIGGALLIGYELYWAGLFATILFGIGLLFFTYAMSKGIRISNCGCYGTLFKFPLSAFSFIHTGFFFALSLYITLAA